jgi:hypothetical protein
MAIGRSRVVLVVSILLVLMLIGPVTLVSEEEFEKQINAYFDDNDKFCWKRSKTRGAGTIPTECSGNRDIQHGLCYKECKPGFTGVGPLCWQKCPKGRTDIGAFCTKKWLGIPIKNPKKKKTKGRGAGKIPTGCSDGKENDAGLCYKPCERSYKGIGPVCWKKCGGDTPVDCGASCGSTTATCVKRIINMVQAVVEMISNIAAMIGTGGAYAVTAASTKQAIKRCVLNIAKKFRAQKFSKKIFLQFMKKKGLKIGAQVSENVLSVIYDQSEKPEDKALNALSNVDPTGVVDVIIAFKHDVC